MTVPAVPSFVQGLRNTRQALGDGTLQGRVRSATPYRERATSAGETAVAAPSYGSGFGMQRLFVRAVADQTIASGGDYIVWETEGLPSRRGFTGWDSGASDEIVMPAAGVLLVQPAWAWDAAVASDGYVTHEGVDYPLPFTLLSPAGSEDVRRTEGRYIDVREGDVVKVKVDQETGADKTMVEAACELVLWVVGAAAVPPEESTVEFVAADNHDSSNTSVDSIDAAIPAEAEDGDLLLVICSIRFDSEPTPATGWTRADWTNNTELGGGNAAVFWKIADGTEAGTTVNIATADSDIRYVNGTLVLRPGPSSPISDLAAVEANNIQTVTFSDVTGQDGGILVCAVTEAGTGNSRNGTSHSAWSGDLTERVDHRVFASFGEGQSIGVATEPLTASGATGTRTVVRDKNDTQEGIAYSIVVA